MYNENEAPDMNNGLTIVLPCLNEIETLEKCINKAKLSIKKLGIAGEIIIADNGSTDGSVELALALDIRVIEVSQKGYGSALIQGIRSSNFEYILMADADDSYALEDIEEYWSALQNGADLVMGNRFLGGIEKGAMPFLHKYLGNPVLSFIGRLFFGSKLGDFHCGLRAFRREAILTLDLKTTGMEFASEMIVKSEINKLNIVEVPTTLRVDGRSRKPHLRTWRDGWRHLRFLLAYSPRWLFLYPGLLISLISSYFLILLELSPREIFGINFAIQGLIYSAGGIMIGMQLVWFAFLAKASMTTRGIYPADPTWIKLLRFFQRETNLLLAVVPICAGTIILMETFLQWRASNFGALDVQSSVKHATLAVTLIALGIQGFFSFFLIGILATE